MKMVSHNSALLSSMFVFFREEKDPTQMHSHPLQPIKMDADVQPLRIYSMYPILKQLMEHQYGWIFNEEVDAVKLNLPHYFDIIKNSMDLGTVKKNLDSLSYKLPEQFASDVRLTFNNAITYNKAEHDVHKLAKDMLRQFEKEYAKVLEEIENIEKNRRLCGGKYFVFEPPCDGTCGGQRIWRSAWYHTGLENKLHLCQPCFNAAKDTDVFTKGDKSCTKKDMAKKKNDERHKEPWVGCGHCGRCALCDHQQQANGQHLRLQPTGGQDPRANIPQLPSSAPGQYPGPHQNMNRASLGQMGRGGRQVGGGQQHHSQDPRNGQPQLNTTGQGQHPGHPSHGQHPGQPQLSATWVPPRAAPAFVYFGGKGRSLAAPAPAVEIDASVLANDPFLFAENDPELAAAIAASLSETTPVPKKELTPEERRAEMRTKRLAALGGR
jgi:hypothetical protein